MFRFVTQIMLVLITVSMNLCIFSRSALCPRTLTLTPRKWGGLLPFYRLMMRFHFQRLCTTCRQMTDTQLACQFHSYRGNSFGRHLPSCIAHLIMPALPSRQSRTWFLRNFSITDLLKTQYQLQLAMDACKITRNHVHDAKTLNDAKVSCHWREPC